MSLVEAYAQQYGWRRWEQIYAYLGDLSGAAVLDIGCGIGDQARDLAARGARVLGIDAHPELIRHAQSRAIPNARFQCGIVKPDQLEAGAFDGVWASFVAAYFPRFETFLDALSGIIEPGGWVALTELDDLFGHRPLEERWITLIEKYYARSLADGLHRFRSQAHVVEVLTSRGWQIDLEQTIEDDEFSFDRRPRADVLEGWRTRLSFMMPRFLERFGEAARGFDTAFLDCLSSDAHTTLARVWFVLARAPGGS